MEVHGLVNAVEYNNKLGEIVCYAQNLSRWMVRLSIGEEEFEVKNLLSPNLRFVRRPASSGGSSGSGGPAAGAASSGVSSSVAVDVDAARRTVAAAADRLKPGDQKVILCGREFTRLKRGGQKKSCDK